MKARHQLERLEPMVLGPVRGLNAPDWHRAPPGKWTVCQILQHLAMGVDLVSETFQRRIDHAPMKRRASLQQTIVRHLLLGIGRIPAGIESPEVVRPEVAPDPQLVESQFRMGVQHLARLVDSWPAQRQRELYVRHPIVGDLNLPEWIRFHSVHCRHHAKQIEGRLRWLKQRGKE